MDDALFIEIQRLFQLIRQRGLRVLSLTRPGFSIAVSTVSAVPEAAPGVHYLPQPPILHAPEEPEPESAAVPRGYEVLSPLVGTFYRTPAPDAPPFVEVGDVVEAGQTVCIIEAMKIFNEIVTDHAGTVIAIPTPHGQLVQVGQTLMVIETE